MQWTQQKQQQHNGHLSTCTPERLSRSRFPAQQLKPIEKVLEATCTTAPTRPGNISGILPNLIRVIKMMMILRMTAKISYMMTIDMIFIVIVNYSNGDWRHLSGSWLFLMAVASINHSTRLSTFHCKIYLSKLLNILVPICLYQPLKPSIVSHIGILQFQTLYKLMPTLSVVNIRLISRVSLTNTFFTSKYQAQIYRWILNWKTKLLKAPPL